MPLPHTRLPTLESSWCRRGAALSCYNVPQGLAARLELPAELSGAFFSGSRPQGMEEGECRKETKVWVTVECWVPMPIIS